MGKGPPPIPGPPPMAALIWVPSIAVRKSLFELVKSCSRSTFTSKLMTNAMSLSRSTCSRKSAPTCFSMGNTASWLRLVSIKIPRVSGRFVSDLKYLILWGLPSSAISKSSLLKLGIKEPRLSLTLKRRLTMLTSTLNVSTGLSGSGVRGAGALAVGFGNSSEFVCGPVSGFLGFGMYWADALPTTSNESKIVPKPSFTECIVINRERLSLFRRNCSRISHRNEQAKAVAQS